MAVRQNSLVSMFMVVVFVFVMTSLHQTHAFSNGASLVTGDSVFREVYCQRPVSDRAPIHMSPECGGPCRPRHDGQRYFTLVVNETSYWEHGVNVTIRAKEGSDFDVQGFTVFAVDRQGVIVGLLESYDSSEVAVGSCEDVVKNTVEGQFAVHAVATPGRRKVTVLWKPDGFNHGTIKFGAWVVHNHSTIFYVESHELSNEKNSDEPLDLLAMYQTLLHDSQASMAQFEDAFTRRGNLGYQIDLDDPFAPFNQPPTLADLLPKSRMNSEGSLGGGRGFGSPAVNNRAISSGILDVRKTRKIGRGTGRKSGIKDGEHRTTSSRAGGSNGDIPTGNDDNDDFQLISIGEWMKSRETSDGTLITNTVSKDDRIIINNLLLVGIGGSQPNVISPNEETHLNRMNENNNNNNKPTIDAPVDDTITSKIPEGKSNTVGNNNDKNNTIRISPPADTITPSTIGTIDAAGVPSEFAERNDVTKGNDKTEMIASENINTGNSMGDNNLISPPNEDAIKVRKPITETTVIDTGSSTPGVMDNEQMEFLSGPISAISPHNTGQEQRSLQKRSTTQEESQFRIQAMESSSNSRNVIDIFGSSPSSSSSSSSRSPSSSNQPPAWAMPPQMSQPANPNMMRSQGGAAGGANPMMNPRGNQRTPGNPFMTPQGGMGAPRMPQRGMNGMPMNPSAMQQQRPPFGQPSQQMSFPGQQPSGSSVMRFPMPNQAGGQTNPMMMMGGSRPGSQPFPMGPQTGQQQLPFGARGPMQLRDGDDDGNPFGAAPMNPFQRGGGQFPQQTPPGFGGNPQMAMGGPSSMGGMMGNQNPMMSQMMNRGMPMGGGQSGFPGSQMGMMSGPGGSPGMSSPYAQASMGMNGPGGGFSSNPFSSMGMTSMMGRGGGGMNGQSSSPFGFPNMASMMGGGGMGNFMGSNGGPSSRGMPGGGMMNPFMGMSGSSRGGGFPGMMPSMGNMGGMSRLAAMYGGSQGGRSSLASMMSRRGMGGFGNMAGMGGMFQRSGGMPGMMPGMMPGFMGSRGSRSG